MRITGTFLDEITHDIPSQNWGPEDWRKEFELYRRIGIDTAIIIRAGYRDKCIFPSRSIPGLLPVYEGLGRMFFDLAEEFEVGLWFGLYDSGHHWISGDWEREADINLAFADEVVDRYGSSPAFSGWYLPFETGGNRLNIADLVNRVGGHCKSVKDVPVLISPYPQGSKQFGEDAFSVDKILSEWQTVFEAVDEAIDVVAFQDGQLQYSELPDFHAGVKELCGSHDLKLWSNIESFDRDMPIKFPPADWRYLRYKMEQASSVAEKLITFEFAHFMSPHSCYPSAHKLFQRYCDHFGLLV